ncbi:MAG TPA: holo-ACP synthase [Flavisolibacter sp.]|nr:holo-ACP synthase [Flavisolibacter sp.]
MIIGIGCDVVEHHITKKLKWDSDIDVRKRIFSTKELESYHAKPTIQFIAGRYAVKEAVLKCLGTGMEDGLALIEIQTLKDENGKPQLELLGSVKRLSDEQNIEIWHVSITHSESYSLAFVIAEGLKN